MQRRGARRARPINSAPLIRCALPAFVLLLQLARSGAAAGAATKRATSPSRLAAAQPPSTAPPVSLSPAQLPALQVTPSGPATAAGTMMTLSLPPNFALSASRLRIGWFAAGTTVRLADIERDFVLGAGGRLQATVLVDAGVGRYDVRLVSNDKARRPLTMPCTLLVPGVSRRPGWWLLNGSLCAVEATPAPRLVPPSAAAPLFVEGLQRATGKKAHTAPTDFVVAGDTPLAYDTLPTPPLTELMAPGTDFEALGKALRAAVAEVSLKGQRNLLGFSLPVAAAPDSAKSPEAARGAAAPGMTATAAVAKLKQILRQLAPTAALLLEVPPGATSGGPAEAGQVAQLLDSCAGLCDAVVIDAPGTAQLGQVRWLIKIARRNAEEQPGYDLPIMVRLLPHMAAGGQAPPSRVPAAAAAVDLLESGVSGLVVNDAAAAAVDDLKAVFDRNLSLLVGSVTLEDIGVLPAPDGAASDNGAPVLYHRLRSAGRIPLLARLGPIEKPAGAEPLMMALGERISDATIEKLRRAAAAGARIYLEGTPRLDENGKPAAWRLGTLVGADLSPLAGGVASRRTAMVLSDPWTFGTGRGTRVAVQQSDTVVLRHGTVAAQARQQKGLFSLTEPVAAASLEDGTPALVVNPVGKGQVLWMPHQLPQSAGSAALNRYYAAIAGALQSPLISLRAAAPAAEANSGAAVMTLDVDNVQCALRRTARGSYLLGLFNRSSEQARVTAAIDGVAGVALDLTTSTELPLTVDGNASQFTVEIVAGGYCLVALSASRATLDAERDAPLLHVKLS